MQIAERVGTMTASKWALSDPTASSQINCYAVAIEVPDDEKNSCLTTGGVVVFKPNTIVGGFTAGSVQEIEVSSGAARTIHLIGMQAASTSECKDIATSASGLNPYLFQLRFY